MDISEIPTLIMTELASIAGDAAIVFSSIMNSLENASMRSFDEKTISIYFCFSMALSFNPMSPGNCDLKVSLGESDFSS